MSSSGQPQRWQALRKLGLAVAVVGVSVAAATLPGVAVQAKDLFPAKVLLMELPPEGVKLMRTIRAGGPFPHDKDGAVFGNRERQLPPHPRGFYREYTVKTPGASDRGARRIVCGGRQPAAPEACYYTADHYASFRQIVE